MNAEYSVGWGFDVDHLDGGAGNDTIAVSIIWGEPAGSTYWGDKIVNLKISISEGHLS